MILKQPSHEQNLYEILKVPSDASEADIQHATDQLTQLYQEQAENNPQARQWLEEVQEAHKILSSPYRRNAYDISLEEQKLEHQLKADEEKKIPSWDQLKKLSQQKLNELLHHEDSEQNTKGIAVAEQNKSETKPPIWQTLKQRWQAISVTDPAIVTDSATVERPRFQFPNPLRKRTSDNVLDDEVLLQRVYIHPLFLLDFWGLLLTLGAGYLLRNDPYDLHQTSPTVNVNFPSSIDRFLPETWVSYLADVSVWNLGIWLLFGIGILILIDVFFAQISTQLLITSQRIILRHGVFWREEVELKLPQLDSITINRSVLGRVFGYGDFKITGAGGTKLLMPHVMRPQRIRRLMWELLFKHERGQKDVLAETEQNGAT